MAKIYWIKYTDTCQAHPLIPRKNVVSVFLERLQHCRRGWGRDISFIHCFELCYKSYSKYFDQNCRWLWNNFNSRSYKTAWPLNIINRDIQFSTELSDNELPSLDMFLTKNQIKKIGWTCIQNQAIQNAIFLTFLTTQKPVLRTYCFVLQDACMS